MCVASFDLRTVQIDQGRFVGTNQRGLALAEGTDRVDDVFGGKTDFAAGRLELGASGRVENAADAITRTEIGIGGIDNRVDLEAERITTHPEGNIVIDGIIHSEEGLRLGARVHGTLVRARNFQVDRFSSVIGLGVIEMSLIRKFLRCFFERLRKVNSSK
jgi:hypothetical protein